MNLGNHKVPQKNVVQWHAKVTQIEDSIRHLIEKNADSDRGDIAHGLYDILADLGSLRGHLPPVQLELPPT